MSNMGQNGGASDAAAIGAVLAGDRDAYGELVKRHSRMLFRLAYRMTGNEADADDVVQDAFLRAYQKLASFESRADFGTWIYRIAVHCALDKLAKRRAEQSRRVSEETDPEEGSIQVPDSSPSPERLALSAEIAALHEVAMRALTPMERTAFTLRHMEDRTTEEIAAALNVTPNTAKQSVYRAVQKVRHRLTQLKVMA
ncbi:RNA polymerase sigma factor [Occallatibacter riparius]|uniref:RNA polymerase sigma factor n=1 Tax=Occallatibacter riparius TaxID=1002689 RepID=A0A9J7BHZ5_9BACT|nr:sigma-70 family RNA polymerase sigma factor [Occallatibacter riparius]UWZ82564.1 sigma-70 family RNA polymerase sigma factor [Occallatibacter riparius]